MTMRYLIRKESAVIAGSSLIFLYSGKRLGIELNPQKVTLFFHLIPLRVTEGGKDGYNLKTKNEIISQTKVTRHVH